MNTNKSKLPNLPSGKTTSSGEREMKFNSKIILKTISSFWVTVAVLLGATQNSYAVAANGDTTAGASIINVAVVTWEDVANVPYTGFDSVTVTVNLVESAVAITGLPVAGNITAGLPGDQTLSSGQTATYYYSINSQANGTDLYDIDLATGLTNYLPPGVEIHRLSFDAAGTSLDESLLLTDNNSDGAEDAQNTFKLGAAIILAAANEGGDEVRLSVPAGAAHGIITGDLVTLDSSGGAGKVYLVTGVNAGTPASIAGNGALTGEVNGSIDIGPYTESLSINAINVAQTNNPQTELGTLASLAGNLLGEIAFIRVRVTGKIDSTSADAELVGTYTVADNANVAAAVFNNTTTWNPLELTITKYVRNVTNPEVGGGTPVTLTHPLAVGVPTLYVSGVTANPGDLLEYLIVIDNSNTAAGVADVVKISDAVPEFTVLRNGLTTYGATNGVGSGTSIFALLSADTNFTAGTVSVDFDPVIEDLVTLGGGAAGGITENSALNFDIGSLATSGGGGTLANNESVYIIYQVVVQ